MSVFRNRLADAFNHARHTTPETGLAWHLAKLSDERCRLVEDSTLPELKTLLNRAATPTWQQLIEIAWIVTSSAGVYCQALTALAPGNRHRWYIGCSSANAKPGLRYRKQEHIHSNKDPWNTWLNYRLVRGEEGPRESVRLTLMVVTGVDWDDGDEEDLIDARVLTGRPSIRKGPFQGR